MVGMSSDLMSSELHVSGSKTCALLVEELTRYLERATVGGIAEISICDNHGAYIASSSRTACPMMSTVLARILVIHGSEPGILQTFPSKRLFIKPLTPVFRLILVGSPETPARQFEVTSDWVAKHCTEVIDKICGTE